ncbi:GlxA family transcriptional regulator [Afipia sp. GAS231]|uniref:GlxA family transcriptional regulator n=1 Tax=Afipia sp. GAS231 TaxID=1882747 RepID=UPI0015605F5B|nr:helix-turn-helix domain-containing protein [Afipia sp. GAS231]
MTSAVFGQMDAFAIAAYIAGRREDSSWNSHDVRIATPDGDPVRGYGGHLIEPHCALSSAGDSDVVLIPPIFNDIEQTLAQERGLVAWLTSFPANSTLLASTCTGAFLLAEAGVLDGRRVTTNPAFSALFEQRYPAVRLALDERLVDDHMVICAGATTAYLNLAIHVIDRLAGHDLAVSTAKALSIDRHPESQRPYFMFIAPRDHGDEKILQLQNWIEVHHQKPIGLEEMTDAAAMSVRNLNRRFLSATGLSPQQYLRRVRIETAKRLLEGRAIAVDRVAEQVGYRDTRAFIRAFGAVAGLSPGEYRRRFRALPNISSP